jgi:hypothetical protein
LYLDVCGRGRGCIREGSSATGEHTKRGKGKQRDKADTHGEKLRWAGNAFRLSPLYRNIGEDKK